MVIQFAADAHDDRPTHPCLQPFSLYLAPSGTEVIDLPSNKQKDVNAATCSMLHNAENGWQYLCEYEHACDRLEISTLDLLK